MFKVFGIRNNITECLLVREYFEFMKIINIHSETSADKLLYILQQKLNPLFQLQRQSNVSFIIENKGDYIEISQPELYEIFLFRIEIKGTELLISRSADYIDDVNALSIESILYILFEELADDPNVSLSLEG